MGLYQVGLGKDVVVNEENQVTGSFPYSNISGCGSSRLGLQKGAQIRETGGFLRQDTLRVIGRVVIDDEDFKIVAANCLMLNAIDRGREHVSAI